jgi:hypothetical protein
MEFKLKYDNIKEGYNTIDTINSQTDQIFKNCILNDTFNRGMALEKLLEYTFTTNKFLANKPSVIMVSSKINGNTLIEIYKILDGVIKKDEKSIVLKDDLSFGLDISIENEFFSNCDDEEYSDIDNYQDVFESEVIQRIHNISNFTGYSTTDTAAIGLNYKHRVSNIDAKIIKGLCINLNLMKNIYTKINEVNSSFIYTANALARAGEAADDDTGNHIKRVNEVSDENKKIKEILNEYDLRISLSTQKIGIVRYSAFEDVGSDLSFSIAILDANDNGFVLTSIYSRENSTTYAKPIIKSVSKYTLSAEETSAIETAKKNYNERQMNLAGIKKDSRN